MTKQQALHTYLLRLGDDSLILSQRLSQLCGHGPILEEDIALTNVALDLIGQATLLLEYSGELADQPKTNDELAYLRLEKEYVNTILVEQPNGHFGDTIMRQFLFDAYRKPLLENLLDSTDMRLAGIAEKSLKETKFAKKLVIILGSENKGLRKITTSLCDEVIKIDISDELESLNVSNTAAIAFYEISSSTLKS